MFEYSNSKNLFDKFYEQFSKQGEKAFVELPDGTTFSYDRIEQISAGIANRLTKDGLLAGDRLMMQVEKSPVVISLFLACLRAGIIFIPLNTAYQKEEMEYLASDARPAAVVCDPLSYFTHEDFNYTSECRVYTLNANGMGSLVENLEGDQFATYDVSDNTIAAILYTSGTTGKPKGAMLTHSNLLSNALSLVQSWQMVESDVLLHALPIFHTHGLFVAINTIMLCGGRLIYLSKFDPDQIFKFLPRSSVFMGVPTYYTRLLNDERLTINACKNMRLFTSGSAPLLEETSEYFIQKTNHHILERYGMTETNMNTSNPFDGERRSGTVGLPLLDVEVRIVGEADGQVLNTGEIGSIEIKGPNVFLGYWQNPEKTKQEFTHDGFFKSGDLGMFDDDNYLTIVGRSKDLIISGGLNIYPKEIEQVIDDIETVTESAIIGLTHDDLGEGVFAVVIAEDPSLDESIVIQKCREKLAGFKSPKAVVFRESLPRNAMGKVEKAKLRAEYDGYFKKN